MDPIRKDLLADLDGPLFGPPEARLVSTVTGEAVEAEGARRRLLVAQYPQPGALRRSHRRDRRGLSHLSRDRPAGHPAVLSDRCAARGGSGWARACQSLAQADDDPFPAIAARCHVAGYDFTSSPSFDGPADPRGLPLYPWDRQSFWFDLTAEAPDPATRPSTIRFSAFVSAVRPCWLNHLDEQVLPWIADHAIEGMPVLPAAGMLEMALAAARLRWPDAPVLEVRDLEVRRPLPFDKGRMREVRAMIGSEDGDWELASRARLSNEPFTVHAVGASPRKPTPAGRCAWLRARRVRRIDAHTLYDLAQLAGLDYGARFEP